MSRAQSLIDLGRGGIAALGVTVLALAMGAIASQVSGLIILIGVFAVPSLIGFLAKPSFAISVVFFCFFTNAHQVLSLWHGFDYLTELIFLVLIALFAQDIWLGRPVPPAAGLFAALLTLNIAFTALQVAFSAEPNMIASSGAESFKYGLIALILILVLRDRVRLQAAMSGIVLALLFMASITAVQYHFGLYHLSFGGFGAVTYHHIVGEFDYWRVDGPLTDPNFYAQILLISLPFACVGLSRNDAPTWRMICLAALVFGLIAIMLTYSRGVLVGLIFLIVLFNLRRWPFILAGIAIFGVISAVGTVPYFARTAAAISDVASLLGGEGYLQDEAIKGRLAEMRVALHLFWEHPFTGIGMGRYEALYQDAARHYGLMARGADREAHSLILELLAERGLIGTAAYFSIVGGAVVCALRAQRRNRAASAMTLTLLYALLAYYLTSLFLHAAFPMYLWLLLALCFAMTPQPQADRSAKPNTTQGGECDDEPEEQMQ